MSFLYIEGGYIAMENSEQSIIGTLDDADAQLEATETLLKVAQEDVLPSYMRSDNAIDKVDTLLLIALDQLREAREQMKATIEQAIEKKEEDRS